MMDRPGEPRPTVTLRPYQAAAIQAAREMVREKRAKGEAGRALIVLPTGCGKTQTAISLLSTLLGIAAGVASGNPEVGMAVLMGGQRAALGEWGCGRPPHHSLSGAAAELKRCSRKQHLAQLGIACALLLALY